MQIRALILLVLALAMGGVTVYLVNSYLQTETGSRSEVQRIDTVPVVVARIDIKPGTRLTDELVKVVQWPNDSLPDEYFSDAKLMLGSPDKAAPILLRETRKGEPILKYFLSPYGARGGLPIKIPEDMRAITISVNEVKGVAGFVLPGDYVDILHTTKVGRSDERPVSRMVLQNVKVLGVDQISAESETEPKVVNAVTLLVNPFDGQRLTLAQHLGDLNMLLRNEFDASLVEESVATYKDLLTIEKDRKVKIFRRARRPTLNEIEIIRGLNIEKKEVKEGEKPSTGDVKTSSAR